MPARAARLIWPEAGCSLSNGPPGRSAVEGGYLLTGEWSFSSGIMQADYLAGVAPVKENGKTIKVLWCFLPKSTQCPVQHRQHFYRQ
jgi:alkylation response protein AidB-like acyl-CoA dehydrogenase